MIARLPGVTAVQDTGTVTGVNAYKSPLIPAIETNAPQRGRRHPGPARRRRHQPRPGPVPERRHRPRAGRGARRHHRPAAGHRPDPARDADLGRPGPAAVVLRGRHPQPGHLRPGDRLGGPGRLPRRGEVPGLRRAPLGDLRPHHPEHQAATTRVDNLLGAQASPENPGQVNVSQPSAALTAQADAKGALDTLFLGLGAVALLVGAIGVANIMIISVLERRSEIGLRRALGATRGQIRAQFLAEAIMLSLAGGAAGVVARRRRHRRLRPRPRRGRRHPARGLGRRPGRRGRHRRPGRAAARHPRRPPVPRPRHSGASDRGQTASATDLISRYSSKPARPISRPLPDCL